MAPGATTPQYFFHVHGSQASADEVGTDLAGDEDARAVAITASAEALKDLGPRFWAHPDWRMHVVDDEGATVCDLRFSNQRGPD